MNTNSVAYPEQITGELKAFTFVAVTDIFGRIVQRRVSLGREYTSMENAKEMVKTARNAQPNISVNASFTVYL